jgi:hypothetical protein
MPHDGCVLMRKAAGQALNAHLIRETSARLRVQQPLDEEVPSLPEAHETGAADARKDTCSTHHHARARQQHEARGQSNESTGQRKRGVSREQAAGAPC